MLTAAFWNTNVRDNSLALPRGYVALTTLATTFTSASFTPVDVTGFTVTFTAEAGRRYLVSLLVNMTNSGLNQNRFYILKAASQLFEGFVPPVTSPVIASVTGFAVDSPSAGSVTYKVQMDAAAGTGTMYGTSTRASLASRLLVEDIGLA